VVIKVRHLTLLEEFNIFDYTVINFI